MIRIDLTDRTPPYQQIRAAILGAIASGELRPADRLPTVRQLAGDLGVAPGTVQRAYAELEADGVVQSGGRRGTFVSDRAGSGSVEPDASLAGAASRFAEEARRLGFGPAEALAAAANAMATRHAS